MVVALARLNTGEKGLRTVQILARTRRCLSNLTNFLPSLNNYVSRHFAERKSEGIKIQTTQIKFISGAMTKSGGQTAFDTYVEAKADFDERVEGRYRECQCFHDLSNAECKEIAADWQYTSKITKVLDDNGGTIAETEELIDGGAYGITVEGVINDRGLRERGFWARTAAGLTNPHELYATERGVCQFSPRAE